LETVEARDKQKGYLSCMFMVLAFVLPVVGFFVGWGQWDAQTGAAIGVGVFVLLMLTAVIIALTIEHISWLFSFLPLLSSFVYTIAPDFVPGLLEDAAVVGVGAFFTLILVLKKVVPAYILLAVLVTGVYAWFGREQMVGFIDELALFLVVLLLGFVVHRNYRQRP
jgi:hypothetical protein